MTVRGASASRRRSATALVLSGLLHVVFAFAIFATATGTAPRGVADPFADGEVFEVSLSGAEGAAAGGRRAASPAEDAALSDLEKLARLVRNEASPLPSEREPARSSGSLAALLNASGTVSAPGRKGVGDQAAGADGVRGQEARGASARPGERSADASAGGLWGQVEPCWRRLSPQSTTPVTLEITLDKTGRLAVPPRIVRPGTGKPDEQRLLAEARALAAIQACLPYRAEDSLGFRRVYRLAF